MYSEMHYQTQSLLRICYFVMNLISGGKKKLQNIFQIFLFVYMDVLPAYMCIPLVYLEPEEARKGHGIPWNWDYRQL